MSKIIVNISGEKLVINQLKKAEKAIDDLIRQTVEINATEGVNVAKQLAPVTFGALRNGITKMDVQGNPLKQKIVSTVFYSGYVEFGTGKRVKVPPEWEEQAMAMKGRKGGTFEEFLFSLGQWAKKKGIDEKDVYFIAISILKKGIEPQPFMYPAWLQTKAQFDKDIRTLIKRINNGNNAK